MSSSPQPSTPAQPGGDCLASSNGGSVQTQQVQPQGPGLTGQKSLGEWVSHYRWYICALLFFATTINYMDRQILGILAPTLQKELGWSEKAYAHMNMAFQAAYAIGFLGAGAFMDRFGTRIGFSVSVIVWSIAAMLHAAARTVMGFGAARFVLGVSESGNFPAAIKTVAEWFPKRERALATGIFNAGSNVGAVITPLLVPLLVRNFGWRAAFVLTGSAGFIWIVFWLLLYRRPELHPKVSPAELAHINSDPAESLEKVAWKKVIGYRQAWAFAIGKLLTDPIWWFFLFWLGKFFDKTFHLKLEKMGMVLFLIYLAADFGSIGGGWISSFLIRKGWSVNAGRKTALLLCALCVVPVVFACGSHNMWTATALIALACAAHQGWSANLFTLVSDTFPRKAVGSVVGFGGMAGAVGGLLMSNFAGDILQKSGQYLPMFLLAGSAYLTALLIIHLLVPRMEPANLDEPAK